MLRCQTVINVERSVDVGQYAGDVRRLVLGEQPLDVGTLGDHAGLGDRGVEVLRLQHFQSFHAQVFVTENHRLQLLTNATDLVTARLSFHHDAYQVDGSSSHRFVRNHQTNRVGRDAVRFFASADGNHGFRFRHLGDSTATAAFRRRGVDDRLISALAVQVAAGGYQTFPDAQDVRAVIAQGVGVQGFQNHLRVQQASTQRTVRTVRAAEAVGSGHAGHVSHGWRAAQDFAVEQRGVSHHLVNRVTGLDVEVGALAADELAQGHTLLARQLVHLSVGFDFFGDGLAVDDRLVFEFTLHDYRSLKFGEVQLNPRA